MQMEMQNKLLVKDEKLKQLKAIVTESKARCRPDPPPRHAQPKAPPREQKKRSASPSPLPVRTSVRRDGAAGEARGASEPQMSSPFASWFPQTSTPVRPLHRRSRSAGGEKWVDHKPPSSVDLGTVLQPLIPNAIQVVRPDEKVLAKCERYVLTHQEVTSDGEIETKLIKVFTSGIFRRDFQKKSSLRGQFWPSHLFSFRVT